MDIEQLADKELVRWLDSIFRRDGTGMHLDNATFFACRICGNWLDYYPDMRITHLKYYHNNKYNEYLDFLSIVKNKIDDEERGIESA